MRSVALLLIFSTATLALEPAEVVVVVNRMVPSSKELGEYYCKARGVPKDNLIELMLPRAEEMTREEYVKWLVTPLREAMSARKDKVKCLLLMSGVPLRVGAKLPSDLDKEMIDRLKPMITAANDKAKNADPAVANPAKFEAAKLNEKLMLFEHRESTASVDSELMLLWWDDYPLMRWQLNPLHWQAGEQLRRGKPPALLTCRLDAPNPDLVKRMIDDAISVEKTGLAGKLYVDARDSAFDAKNPRENGGYGYGGYDESMRELAALFEKHSFPTVLDNKPGLFAANSCPDTALYCGWYSHGQYIDSFTFNKGAVAWHLASSEAVTLRDPNSKLWCPNLIKNGVCATIGPVAEPYTVGFPKPAEFFGMLATGQYTLAEVHGRTVHFASWMMVCLGDPLYNPFKAKPLLKESDLFASPKAGKSFFR